MAVVGAIAERARGIIPITWSALSADARFGDARLQTTIDTVKEAVFGTVSLPGLESALPLIVVDYVAKLVVLELINPGMDLLRATAPTSVGATGTNEQEVFVDPVETLRQLRVELLAETTRLKPTVDPLINFRRVSGAPRPLISTLDDPFLTPSPQEFPRPYRATDRS